jgi:hypothetical protein
MIKGQQREEPYEATSLKYGFEAAVGWVTDPPTATVGLQGRADRSSLHRVFRICLVQNRIDLSDGRTEFLLKLVREELLGGGTLGGSGREGLLENDPK